MTRKYGKYEASTDRFASATYDQPGIPISQLIAGICIILLLAAPACGSRESSFSCLSQKYSESQLIFFSRVGFRQQKVLQRWNSDIKVSLGKGEVSERDILTVDSIILELAPLIKPLAITRVPEGGDIVINIVPPATEQVGASASTRTYPNPLTKYLSSARIYVRPHLEGRRRQAVLRHEFLHAIGLADPVGSFEPMGSRLEGRVVTLDDPDPDYEAKDYLYTDMDKAAVSMLYEECLSSGWQKSEYVASLKRLNIVDHERVRRTLN